MILIFLCLPLRRWLHLPPSFPPRLLLLPSSPLLPFPTLEADGVPLRVAVFLSTVKPLVLDLFLLPFQSVLTPIPPVPRSLTHSLTLLSPFFHPPSSLPIPFSLSLFSLLFVSLSTLSRSLESCTLGRGHGVDRNDPIDAQRSEER